MRETRCSNGPLLTHSSMSMSVLHWGAQNWTQVCHLRGKQRGMIISLALLARLLLVKPGTLLIFLLQGHVAGSWSTSCPFRHPVFFYEADFQPDSPKSVVLHEIIPPQEQDFALPFADFMKFSAACFSRQLRSLLMAVDPSDASAPCLRLILSANFLT